MKTTKSIMIVLAIAFAAMAYAHSDHSPLACKITLKQACENRGLVQAIYQQVDERTFLAPDHNGYYIARVLYNRTIYLVYGKYEEWERFFLMDRDLCKAGYF
jgi:hypothetical protein